MGFCVASTMKGVGNGLVSPLLVTVRSCIDSSNADWVFGGARLISSASTKLANTGPAWKVNCRAPLARSSCRISVPVMSDGIKSGVNWMRRCDHPRASARVRTSIVLARPGAPVRRTWPPANNAMSTASMVADWPITRCAKAAVMRVRAAATCAGSEIETGDDDDVMGITLSH